jgi:acetyl-CoA synthetase
MVTPRRPLRAGAAPVAGAEPGKALRERIVDDTRTRLSKHEYPRELEFVDHIPTTESGKIRRDALGE